MKLSDLLAAYGENATVVQLDQCEVTVELEGPRARLSFPIEDRLATDALTKVGLVVWLDRDRVDAIVGEHL